MKSVLVHVNNDDALNARLQTALDLTRASGGHLTCLHITPQSTYVAFDGLGGVYAMENVAALLNDTIERVKGDLYDVMNHEDVSWNYKHVNVSSAKALATHSSLQDVLVVSRPSIKKANSEPLSLFSDILFKADVPMLVVPPESKGYDVTGSALVAWNGSVEASNALRKALPLLKMADMVHILCVSDDARVDLPPLEASEYLSRHGIASEIHEKAATTSSIPSILVSSAQDLGASTIVMGAYGHSRAFEFVFGGVTRHLLKECPVHLLVSR